MKLLIGVLLGVALFLTGCSKDSTTDSGIALSVDQLKVELLGGGESKVLTVTTNAAGWTAVRPDADTWCTLTTDGNKLTITAEANSLSEKRTTRITVSASGAADCFVEVTQNPTDFPGLPAVVELSVSGKEKQVTVYTTRPLAIAEPPAAWCTVEISGNVLFFSATRNDGAMRETSVKISDGVATMIVTIRQNEKKESEYAVGDLFKEDGNVTGIVAYVDGDEGHAFVLALDEIIPSTDPTTPSSIWSFQMEAKNQFGTTDDDGQANMEIWRTKFASSNRYKAFYVCDAKNKDGAKDWFLPSRDEFLLISKGITTFGLAKFNEKIVAESGTPVGTYYYWSSSEAASVVQWATIVCLSNGQLGSQYKADDMVNGTRAARKI